MTNNVSLLLYGAFGFIVVFVASSLIAPLFPFICTAFFCFIFYALFHIIKDDNADKNLLDLAIKTTQPKENE